LRLGVHECVHTGPNSVLQEDRELAVDQQLELTRLGVVAELVLGTARVHVAA
jgi:hypothetical protein